MMKTMKRLAGYAFGVLFLAFLLALSGCGRRNGGEATETESGGSAEADDLVLYYNISTVYSIDGSTLRSPDKRDGYFHVELAANGRTLEVRVKERSLVSKMDRLKVMALTFDENRSVTAVETVDEAAGGYLYYNCWLTKMEERHLTLNMSSSGEGYSEEFDLPEGVPIYNVSDYSALKGATDRLYETDKLIVVANKDGSPKAVYIVERIPGVDANHVHCVCTEETKGLGDHVCSEFRFAPWNNDTSLPSAGGNYFLNCDITLKTQMTTALDAKVVICLNGHTVNGALSRRVFSVFNDNSEIILTDCQENVGRVIGHGDTDQGGMIWAAKGPCTIYAGIYDASEMFTRNHNGAAIAMEGGHTVTMYGGTVIGGRTAEKHYGGSVYVIRSGKFIMYGGTIMNGEAPKASGGNIMVANGGEAYFYGGLVTGGRSATGGNMCVLKGGYAEIAGTRFTNGEAYTYVTDTGGNSGGHGGNISNSGTILMTGGAVSNGVAATSGGNISVLSNDGVFTMTGGTISGGTADNGAGLYAFYAPDNGAGPKVEIAGGMITENVTREGGSGGSINVSAGTVTVSGGMISGGNAPSGHGGNVTVSKTGRFEMTGGTISDGLAETAGNIYVQGPAVISGGTVRSGISLGGTEDRYANIQVYGDQGDLSLSGGIIGGSVLVSKGKLTVSGSAKIASVGGGLNFQADLPANAVTFEALSGAVIYVSPGKNGTFASVSGAFTSEMLSMLRPLPESVSLSLQGSALTAGGY